jgi:hypothetical protein
MPIISSGATTSSCQWRRTRTRSLERSNMASVMTRTEKLFPTSVDSKRVAMGPQILKKAWAPLGKTRDGILGHQFYKRFDSFAPCYSQFLLMADLKKHILFSGFRNPLKKPRNRKIKSIHD